ncbi:hypothetical protein D3C80_1880820 [compost metagenome]
MLLAGILHPLESFCTNALEAVRACAGLKGAAAENLAAGQLHQTGNLVDLLRGFHRAGAAHNDQLAAADFHTLDLDNGICGMEFPAGHLVGLGDADNLLHT